MRNFLFVLILLPLNAVCQPIVDTVEGVFLLEVGPDFIALGGDSGRNRSNVFIRNEFRSVKKNYSQHVYSMIHSMDDMSSPEVTALNGNYCSQDSIMSLFSGVIAGKPKIKKGCSDEFYYIEVKAKIVCLRTQKPFYDLFSKFINEDCAEEILSIKSKNSFVLKVLSIQ